MEPRVCATVRPCIDWCLCRYNSCRMWSASAHDVSCMTCSKLPQATVGVVLAAQVLELASWDEASGVTRWRLADVRANAPVKGRKLSKRQREMTFDIPLAAITRARIHVDF